MAKALILSFLYALSLTAFSQSPSDYIRFYGKVLSEKDTSTIQASMSYEKLPYYDDMGLAKTSDQGGFEFYLLKGTYYTFTINGQGHQQRMLKVLINDNGDSTMQKNFFLEAEEEPDIITLENLIFARGSDRISESSHQELDELVEWLDTRPTVTIQLEGHTDFDGNPEANMRLSKARVDAVKEYLIKKGINKKRVLTKAFGGTQPLYTERTDEAKTKNRRVEVRVISK